MARVENIGRRRRTVALSSAVIFLAAAALWSVCLLLRSATWADINKASPEKSIAPCIDSNRLAAGTWNDPTQSWAPSRCVYNETVSSQFPLVQPTRPTAAKASPEKKSIAPCSDLDSLTTGSWNDTTQRWTPSRCFYDETVSSQFPSCLNNKTMSFYGDSTLRKIVNELLKLAKVDHKIKLETWGKAPYYSIGGGKMAGNSSRGEIKMHWTPSAYYQQPARIPSALDRDDVAVISIGAWDMVNTVLPF